MLHGGDVNAQYGRTPPTISSPVCRPPDGSAEPNVRGSAADFCSRRCKIQAYLRDGLASWISYELGEWRKRHPLICGEGTLR